MHGYQRNTAVSLSSIRSAQTLRIAAGVGLLFALIMWKRGLPVAATVILSFLAAYVTEFYSFRCVSALLRRQRLATWTIALGLSGLAVDIVLMYFGFGIVLGMALGMFLLIDGVVLRFN